MEKPFLDQARRGSGGILTYRRQAQDCQFERGNVRSRLVEPEATARGCHGFGHSSSRPSQKQCCYPPPWNRWFGKSSAVVSSLWAGAGGFSSPYSATLPQSHHFPGVNCTVPLGLLRAQ